MNSIKLSSFTKYAQQMRNLSHLNRLKKDQREALLQDLYNVARFKARLDDFVETERDEAPAFRRWRQFLNKAQIRLRKALRELVGVAELTAILPERSDVVAYFDFDWEQFRKGIIMSANRLEHSITRAEELEGILAAMINPRLRTKSEKVLVNNELYERYGFSVRLKSSELDHWLVVEAAFRLDKYQDKGGRKIPRYDCVISELFSAAFGQIETAESIRKALRRHKSKLSAYERSKLALNPSR